MSTAAAPIKPGSKLPAGYKLKKAGDPGAQVPSEELAQGKTVIVTVPGAFTPTCSNQVPGYISAANEFAAKGVNKIVVVAVNDALVLGAWQKHLAPSLPSNVEFLADDTGSFVSSLGLVFDATPLLGTQRAKRAVVVVENGEVKDVAVEDQPSQLTVTDAQEILKKL